MSTTDPGVPGWVPLIEGIQFRRGWLTVHTPDLYAAWVRADGPRERTSVAARILRAAADIESEDDPTEARGVADPALGVWTDLAERLDPRLTAGADWWPLAAALTRADAAGYDVAVRLPALAGAGPLPARHPARELHFRLLGDCAQPAPGLVLDRAVPSGPAPAGRRR
ncbi:MAG: hypothetical protein ACR2JO_05800 [Mycobacteriales bacterium]